MLPQEIIRNKRNRQPLSADEISEFIKGITDGSIKDAQKAALTQLLQELGRQFPASLTVGHCDLNPQKACPSFDAVKEYKGHLSAVTLRSGVGLFL